MAKQSVLAGAEGIGGMSAEDEAAFDAMQQAEIEPPAPGETEATQTEAEGEDVDAQAVVEGKPKTVPHQALHAEREEHKKTQAELQRLREERARFDERLRIIQEMQQRREEPEPEEVPDIETDPVGVIRHLQAELAELKQGGQQQTEQQREQARVQHLANAAVEDARQFKAKTADYGDAYEFWKTNRAEELAAFGVPAAQIPTILGNEQLSIAQNAFQRGVSPAETLYNVAKHRGYKAKAADFGEGEAAERVERVANGQQRSVSLSGTGGGASPSEMTASRLLAMSNEEFDAWTTKNPAKAARLMGQEPPRRR